MVGGDHSFFVRFLPLGKDGVAPRKENASACFSLRLRSAAKNDAPCRFLNALVQIPVVKYRKTKTDKQVCLSALFGGKLESQFELYAYCNLFYIKYFLITKHI